MATNLVAPEPLNDLATQSPLYDQITAFYGNQFRFLLAALRYPGQTTMWLAAQAGITDTTVYRWNNENPAFANVWKQIQAMSGNLRTAYATAAFLEATPDIADAMVTRAKGDKKDAQRAGERILETVGVLAKPGELLPKGVESIDLVAISVRRNVQALPIARPAIIEAKAEEPDAQDAPDTKA